MCITKLDQSIALKGILLHVSFLVSFISITILITRISKFSIMSKLLFTCVIKFEKKIFSFLMISTRSRYQFLAFFLIGGGACAFLCMSVDNPEFQMTFFTMIFVAGSASYIINDITCELYPTHLRYGSRK